MFLAYFFLKKFDFTPVYTVFHFFSMYFHA